MVRLRCSSGSGAATSAQTACFVLGGPLILHSGWFRRALVFVRFHQTSAVCNQYPRNGDHEVRCIELSFERSDLYFCGVINVLNSVLMIYALAV